MKITHQSMLCFFLLVAFACKKKSDVSETVDLAQTEASTEEISETNRATDGSQTIDDCDEFMDQYEVWMEEYVALIEKYKEKPVELVTAPEYMEMSMKAMDWATKWGANLATSCATNTDYEKRFKEINEKAEKKLKAIGLK